MGDDVAGMACIIRQANPSPTPRPQLTTWCAEPGTYRMLVPDTGDGTITVSAGPEGCQLAKFTVSRNAVGRCTLTV